MQLDDRAPDSERKAPVSVLLADDHPIWRAAVRSLLEDTEFDVVGEATTGEQTLLETRRQCPQLVLLDVRLGTDSGMEILAMLKRECPQIVVVLLTASDYPTFRPRALARGADGYLVKGVDRECLLATLRAAVS